MLRSRLRQIATHLDDEVDPAVRMLAERIASGARDRAPVGATGRLKDSIHTEKRDDATWAVVAGDEDVFYGHMVEHGTTKTSPRPFLIPAAEAERDKADDLVRQALKDV